MESETPPTPEQIGELIFLPNPEYPYPFPVESPPHFWMTEQTGKLSEAMEVYFAGEKLTLPQLALVKLYLQQYVERAVIAAGSDRRQLLSRIAKLKTVRDIERFADELSEYGIEPF